MGQKIMIEPVTRIEGHAKVGIYLDDKGTTFNWDFFLHRRFRSDRLW